MDRNLLPAISAFAEVVREGSFSRAAIRLGISPSALSQSIRALEDKLSVRLLNRSTRSLSVTEEGRNLLRNVEPALAVIADAVTKLAAPQDQPAGEVRIDSSHFAAHQFLAPHVGEFSRRYPQIRLEMVLSDTFSDIISEGCDAGIRLREAVRDTMVAIPISPPLSMAVVATPDYFATNPPPENPFDLERHNCIRFRPGLGGIAPWEFTDPVNGDDFAVDPAGSLVSNSDSIMLSAALQGVGMIMHFDLAVQKYLATGGLIRVLEAWCPPFDGFDLYLPTRLQMAPKLRALIDFFGEKRSAVPGTWQPRPARNRS
ncbi:MULTISPECIES: LysR family transcriptional regulator [unclassified Sinorhizobium]|uniref:LysR family transcriptional regulator n=1 Tax=unclassified Sinorhizobium TaxID=2613772 RepID=UPI0024C37217|nr:MULTISPECIES: LysR family transcriptional regulator [unclassified Sinorhizobium]MDK1373339.1 LysR family transcriptional regulator [Sinorhizobium sp. 6-70]MDK1482216.1 LysR family transcriptional regulator [Sinorhizobium sp. 6-117]